MIAILQHASVRDPRAGDASYNRTQPAILCIGGQPFTSNVPSTPVEADHINQVIDEHTTENERTNRN